MTERVHDMLWELSHSELLGTVRVPGRRSCFSTVLVRFSIAFTMDSLSMSFITEHTHEST